MTKIAFISTMHGHAWGGSEELWGQTAERLAQRGHAVSANVVIHAQFAKRLKDLESAGIQISRRPLSDTLKAKITRRLVGERSYIWLDAVKPDFVVVSQGANTDGYAWMQACVERNIPFATIAQTANDLFWPPLDLAREISEPYEQAKSAFFVSQANLDLTRRQIASPLPNAQVAFNPFGVPYNAAPAWSEPADGVHRLACVARLESGPKGQDLIFEVMRQEKWRRRSLHVTLYGSGFNEGSLKALHAMFRLENVTFGGYVDGMEAIWQTHHALILPSRYEGLPLAVVEAMLCERMCIVTDVAGNREIVEDDRSGFIAAAPVTRALDEAMERAWTRRSEWREMGQAAKRRARALVPPDPIEEFISKLTPLFHAS